MNIWKYLLYILVLVQAQAVFAAEEEREIAFCAFGHTGSSYACRQEISYLDGAQTERPSRQPASTELVDESP